MEILMYGWEFPPRISGGLGVACFAIVQELARRNIKVNLVLPQGVENLTNNDNVSIIGCESLKGGIDPFYLETFCHNVNIQKVEALLHPYLSEESYQQILQSKNGCHACQELLEHPFSQFSGYYGGDLIAEVFRYAVVAGTLGAQIPHDVIHCHDWLTVLAGIEAKKRSNKPLIYHAHALEPDRSGEHVNQSIFEIEKYGMEQADRIASVSQYTKDIIVKHYGISPDKITVVHNGMYHTDKKENEVSTGKSSKMVLFLGRITHQKGPYFFVEIARKILSKRKDVEFVMAGSGDMMNDMIECVASMRIGKYVHFTGFLDPETVDRLYNLADVYVMPSVSEPFGLTCLEALSRQVPVVISKQSGVSEVLEHALKADFWDADDMAAKILALLDYQALRDELLQSSAEEVSVLTWGKTAEKLIKIYNEL